MSKDQYAIIGKNVTKNARSPKLWNKVFENLGMPHRMGSIDLELTNAKHFQSFVSKNPQIKGYAIAYPNKIYVAELLYPNLPYFLGVNVVRNDLNVLTGMNTDGDGAIEVLQTDSNINFVSLIDEFHFFIYGTGSTARSFQNRLLKFGVKSQSIVFITTRNSHEDKIEGSSVRNNDTDFSEAKKKIILVNATPLGSIIFPDEVPFNIERIKQFKDRIQLIFDFNYGVKNSGPALIAQKNSVEYIDGTLMNLYQAAYSFRFATSLEINLDINQIFTIMREL